MSYRQKLCSATFTVILLCFYFALPARADTVNFTGGFTAVGVIGTSPRCPSQIVDLTGSGSLSQVGSFTTVQSHCIAPPSPAFTEGEFTFTFDRGTLLGTYAGSFTGPPVDDVAPFTATFAFTGGTGAFIDATGGGTASGMQNLMTGFSVVNLIGTVEGPQVEAIPEPASLILMGTGIAGVATAVRKRRQIKRK